MKDEPEIVKELREAEKFGRFQSKIQGAYDELETTEESSEDVPDETIGFAEDAAEGKARDDDTNYEKTKGASWILRETWRSLTENTGDTVMVVDNNDVIQYVNKTIPPTTPESVVGKTVYEYVSKEHHDVMRKSLKKVYETGQPDTYEVSLNMTNINPKLGILWFRTKVIPIKTDKEISGVIMLATDITERKNVEEALIESEEKYRDLFENVNDIIQAVRPDGSFYYANSAWRKILGYTNEEIANLSVFDIIHPDSKKHCMEVFKRILSGETVKRVEASFITKKGKKIIVEGSISCRFKDGKPVATRGIFRDITDRKKSEEKLKEKMADLERYKKVTVGREIKMVELKKRIKELEGEKNK